jgi:hypothetical protein
VTAKLSLYFISVVLLILFKKKHMDFRHYILWGMPPSVMWCHIDLVRTDVSEEPVWQLAHAGSWLADFSTLKVEAIRSSETSVHTRSTRRYIPEDGILHSHRSENLRSYIDVLAYGKAKDVDYFLRNSQSKLQWIISRTSFFSLSSPHSVALN